MFALWSSRSRLGRAVLAENENPAIDTLLYVSQVSKISQIDLAALS